MLQEKTLVDIHVHGDKYMRSPKSFYNPLLKSLFIILFFLLQFYPGQGMADTDQEKIESHDSINAFQNSNITGLDDKNMDIQDKTAMNKETPSQAQTGAAEPGPIDANLENAEIVPDTEKVSTEQAVYPGVQNASITRKVTDGPSLEIYYPVFGNQAVDSSIKLFAEKQASEYEKDIAESATVEEDRPNDYERWEMSGYFNIERPNPDVVSVIFNIFSYSGGAHGNLAITCLNYNLKTGASVDFADLFKDPEKALEMMSSFSAQKLNIELGEYADEDMILSGTSPDLTNFSNLSLVPGGLYIEFQPYQVGPWAAGPQRVEMTLQDLAAAGPEPDIWPAALNLPVPPADKESGHNADSDPSGQNEQD